MARKKRKKLYITKTGKVTRYHTKTRYYSNEKQIGKFKLTGGAGYSAGKGINRAYDVKNIDDLESIKEISDRIRNSNAEMLMELNVKPIQLQKVIEEHLAIKPKATIADALESLSHTKAFGAKEEENFQDYVYKALQDYGQMDEFKEAIKKDGKYQKIDKSKFVYVGNDTYKYDDIFIKFDKSPEDIKITNAQGVLIKEVLKKKKLEKRAREIVKKLK